MKMMHGACFLAWSNMSRTRLAPTPTNISTKSEPEMEKNGTLASPAIALASKVLPVPGGPTISTPRGMRPPSFWNLDGSLRNSTSSPTSSLASSQPATSPKLTLTWSSPCNLARDLPKLIAPRPPPPDCIWRMNQISTATKMMIGSQLISRPNSEKPLSDGCCWTWTLCLSKVGTRLSSAYGATVLSALPSLSCPVMAGGILELMVTLATLLSLTFCTNVEYGICCAVLPCGAKLWNTATNTTATTSQSNRFLTIGFMRLILARV